MLANCLHFLLVSTKEQSWNRPISVPIYSRNEEQNGTRALPHLRNGRVRKNPQMTATDRL